MARQEWESWLDEEVEDDKERPLRRRFYSLYLDMLEVCRADYGRVANLHALAAYIVWRHTPTKLRVPASQIELASLLGYSKDDVFRKWRGRYPELFGDTGTRTAMRQMVLDQIADVTSASLECATTGGVQGFQDRRMLLEIAGIYKPSVDTNLTAKVALDADQFAALQVQARTKAAGHEQAAATAWQPGQGPDDGH